MPRQLIESITIPNAARPLDDRNSLSLEYKVGNSAEPSPQHTRLGSVSKGPELSGSVEGVTKKGRKCANDEAEVVYSDAKEKNDEMIISLSPFRKRAE